VSRHVAAHRWADAFAGKLGESEVAAMDQHAATCTQCSRARDRVHRASQSFPALRAQSAPDLGWDSVRARVHWSVSSEKRARDRDRKPRLVTWIGVGALAAGAAAVAIVTGPADTSVRTESKQAAAALTQVPAVEPTQLGALVVREVGDQTMINGLVRREIFEQVLGAGAVIATGNSTLDVQFDSEGALALGPHSKLTLARFDSERIELALQEGTVDVIVGKRAAGQRFVVVAGDRNVEVRGTQFRVSRGEARTRIACAHGRVVVRDGGGELVVGADQGVTVAAGASVQATQAVALPAAERELLAAATPRTLPVWTTPAQLVDTSSPLEVASHERRDVRIDGLEVGQGPLRMRVMPGRHTVEIADTAGRFRRAGWVDANAGKAARLEVHAEVAAPTSGAGVRRKQLLAGIDRARLANCTRAMAKAGLSGAFVKIEISVDETGSVQFLNVIDTDVPSTTSRCVRDVLADVAFQAGPPATFREKLDL
jgi:hypothetical protein